MQGLWSNTHPWNNFAKQLICMACLEMRRLEVQVEPFHEGSGLVAIVTTERGKAVPSSFCFWRSELLDTLQANRKAELRVTACWEPVHNQQN